MQATSVQYGEVKRILRTKSKDGRKLIADLAKAELERRRKENPLKYFVPNGAIEKFFTAVGDGERTGKWIFILPAANSLGKSAAAINVLGNIIWGGQSEWTSGDRYHNWPFPKKFWYISQQSTLKDFICGIDDSTESEIRKWFPPGRYEFNKAGYDYYSRLTTDTGWSGAFKTYDMAADKFESDKIGVAVFDEPPPEVIYNAVLARMTLGGIIMMPMTPLTYSAWVKDRLIDAMTPSGPVWVMYADIEENCAEHGVRGRLAHKRIEELIEQYDPDEREARARGVFAHLSGLVYKGVHPDIHRHELQPRSFKQITPLNEEGYRIYSVCDPHDARPPIIGWLAVDRFENVYVVDEFPFCPEFRPFHELRNWKHTTEEVCQWIRRIEERNGWDPRYITRVMDPNFGRKPVQAVGKTIAEHYAECGRKMKYPLNFNTTVNDDLMAGHQIVRDFLAVNPDGGTHLRVGVNCTNIWWDLTHYTRRQQSAKSLDANGPTELVTEKFKDGADVLRYGCVFLRKPGPVKPAKRIIRTMDDIVDVRMEKLRERVRRRSGSSIRDWSQV